MPLCILDLEFAYENSSADDFFGYLRGGTFEQIRATEDNPFNLVTEERAERDGVVGRRIYVYTPYIRDGVEVGWRMRGYNLRFEYPDGRVVEVSKY